MSAEEAQPGTTPNPEQDGFRLGPIAPRPSLVSDRAAGVIMWISALILLTPLLVFVYVYVIRNRLLGDAP
ncbi:MAG: hypothetical protein KJ057_08560 [Phycisphaerae bacterium]|nr:MAG: hypothetical protein F9K17_00095 [Phycisphaerae bacterium]MBE7456185.1 hypothetical protein [Planctomycetia bacterium]MCK6465974.1 hypothetical protein [Phycisphaerae bacterium]MCL4718510.1 hypothetical protein [Phycisphaerae bacterium]NUQ09587.1 hypothetical protein [Phycisphaerae bacterium]